MIQFSKHNRFNTALKEASFKSTFSRIQKEGMVCSYVFQEANSWSCQKLAAEYTLPGQTPVRANPLAYGVMGQNHHANNVFILLYNMLVSIATYEERVNGLCEFPFRKTYVKCTQGL
jgi:hypothetical protein